MTVDGIPLAAWNGVSTEQAQIFRMKGVRTVEEVSKLTDTHMQNMGIPGLLNIRENAKRFIQAQDKNAVTDALAKKDAEIAELRAQMTELIELVKEAKAAPPPVEQKRRDRTGILRQYLCQAVQRLLVTLVTHQGQCMLNAG